MLYMCLSLPRSCRAIRNNLVVTKVDCGCCEGWDSGWCAKQVLVVAGVDGLKSFEVLIQDCLVQFRKWAKA